MSPLLAQLAPNTRRRAVARSTSVPAPFRGWNAKDPISDMEPEFAIRLENWFPEEDQIQLRKGYEQHMTGITGVVETLMTYRGPTTQKLFACANNEIYDASSSGAVGSAVVASLSNNRWEYTNFQTSAGDYIICVNGDDTARKYDGSSWATTAITGSGLTPTDLSHIIQHHNRLFFLEKDTTSFWFLDVETIAGTASKFNIGPYLSKGGHLVSHGTWSVDGGAGMDDHYALISSEGEVVVYSGTDPSDASKWTLLGVYQIGKPIGKRCMMKYGGDLIIITDSGFVPMTKALVAVDDVTISLSENIKNAVHQASVSYGTNFGWQALQFTDAQMLIFNIPIKTTPKAEQYVMNTGNGSWCKFTGWNAACWAEFNGNIYFGDATLVNKAWTGSSDNNGNIIADAKQAFSYFRPRGRTKLFTMTKPLFISDGTPEPQIQITTDFSDEAPISTPTTTTPSGSPWDTSPWDSSTWSPEGVVYDQWQGAVGEGRSASIRFKLETKTTDISWIATDWIYEVGGFR
jgi:hypothetical protein